MALYSIDQIIGKTLVAKSRVPLYRLPYPDAEGLGYIEPGKYVGLVYSYLEPSPANGRYELWWMFAPATGSGNYYYAPHRAGLYDVSALKEQGVETTEEKIKREAEEKRKANEPWYMGMLKTALPWVAGIAIAVVAVPELIKKNR